MGSFAVESFLTEVTTVWYPDLQTYSHSLLPHGQLWCGLGMCLQGSESAGRHIALILEVRSSEQVWKSHILEAHPFLLVKRPENTLSIDAFPSMKEDSFPNILSAERHTLLESACLEVIFQL